MAIYHNISTKGSVSPSVSTGASISPSVSVSPSVSPSMPNKVYYDVVLDDGDLRPGDKVGEIGVRGFWLTILSKAQKRGRGFLYHTSCDRHIQENIQAGTRLRVAANIGHNITGNSSTILFLIAPHQVASSSQIPDDTICVDGVCYEAFDKQGAKQKFYHKPGGIVAAKQQKEPILGVDIPFLNEEDLVQPITR